MSRTLFYLCFIFPLFSNISNATDSTFEIDQKASYITFTSMSTFKIKGKTNKINAWIKGEPLVLSSLKVQATLKPTDFDIKSKRRYRMLQEKCLESDKFPEITFNLKDIISQQPALISGRDLLFKIHGIINIHGVEKIEEIPLHVFYDKPGRKIQVESTFFLRLSHYALKRPRIFFIKTSDLIKVNANLLFTTKK